MQRTNVIDIDTLHLIYFLLLESQGNILSGDF